jgi:hypothetical protein
MPKLNSRQIVILAVAALAVVYGAYDVYTTHARKAGTATVLDAGRQVADAQKFVAEVTQNLAQQQPSALDAYVVGRAEGQWLHDPFCSQKLYRSLMAAPKTAASAPLFSYTGYLAAGHRSMGIINGVEYRAGEALEMEGYYVKAITPSKATIVSKLDGTRIDVPIQE